MQQYFPSNNYAYEDVKANEKQKENTYDCHKHVLAFLEEKEENKVYNKNNERDIILQALTGKYINKEIMDAIRENISFIFIMDGFDEIFDKYNQLFYEMESFKDFPKIFIVDACRGENNTTSNQTTMKKTNINKDMPFGQLLKNIKLLLLSSISKCFLVQFFLLSTKVQAVFHQKLSQEKTKKSYKNELKLINQKEEEIQIIIHYWIRTLNIKLGWIKDFDKLVVNYAPTIFMFETFRSSSKLINTFTGHTNIVWSIDYSILDDCQFICSGSNDKKVRVWDVDNNKKVQSLNGYSKNVYCVKFSSYHYHNHCQHVICSSTSDKIISFWDFKHNQQLQIFNEHTDCVCGIEFSSFNGGRYLCSGSFDKTIRLWDVETLKSLHVFNGHENTVWCVDISPLQSNNKNDKIKMIK
ncbi:serine/threonine protein kinase [Reticulomyxa filosa]|uniref:Serine/threonine protein kinase n=1 Tax=Reticulomyxa filosa TaxID=46433 RepID=X6PC58_RETFI|nr:serine/threonine protein kinase [Reticulomyxa filosa]|eukprot:ETO35761.1 serine/threonine protein kinase [Reticulomyxa filosa]